MVFVLCHLRERLSKFLYIVQILVLAGMVYYYFQGSVRKTSPKHEISEESSQPKGETIRPVWGLMDKCYPRTAQRRRVKPGTQRASETGAALGKESDQSQDKGKGNGKAREVIAVYPTEASEEKRKEESPGDLVPLLLRKFWLD